MPDPNDSPPCPHGDTPSVDGPGSRPGGVASTRSSGVTACRAGAFKRRGCRISSHRNGTLPPRTGSPSNDAQFTYVAHGQYMADPQGRRLEKLIVMQENDRIRWNAMLADLGLAPEPAPEAVGESPAPVPAEPEPVPVEPALRTDAPAVKGACSAASESVEGPVPATGQRGSASATEAPALVELYAEVARRRHLLRLTPALSFIIPGSGQFVQRKRLLGTLFFIIGVVLWVFLLGWIVHVIAAAHCWWTLNIEEVRLYPPDTGEDG